MSHHDLAEEATAFIASIQTFTLATLDANAKPAVSYTPYCQTESGYGIFISALSEHTQQLIDNPALSIMWIADENSSPNPFARQRMIATASATHHPHDSDGHKSVVSAMSTRFPDMMAVLSTLSDFQAFELNIHSYRYIKGFGKAYHSSTGNLQDLIHIAPAN